MHSQGGSFQEPPTEIMNENSYLNNSSVAKTAVHKRRNMPISPNQHIDRGGLDTAQHLNGISRPSINNTYDGSNMPGAAKTASRNQNAIKRTDAGIEQRRKEREQKHMNNQNYMEEILHNF